MNTLIVIDMQNDFIDGVLGTQEAQAIIPSVVRKINAYTGQGRPVFYTLDTHSENYLSTQEGKNLPVTHCLKGTDGWQLNPEIASALPPDAVSFEKGIFGSHELGLQLKELYESNQLDTVELVGVCTGICVVSNAVIIKTLIPELPITVDSSCCACVTPDSHRIALEAMKLLQIEVI